MAEHRARGDNEPAVLAEASPDDDGASRRGNGDISTDPPSPDRDLAGALHEVSNALTVVLGWIEQARSLGNDDVVSALEIASSRARQARHIVRRAIGADVKEDLPCGVSDLVRDAVMGLEPEARRLELRLRAMVDPTIASAAIEQSSIALQILTNLLLNALAVSPAGSAVRIEAAADDPFLIFAVTDDGPGISPARRATLFDAGVSTRAGGAGIGLRHAAALARASGGELSLAESPRGARFELRWRRASAATNRRPSSPTSASLALAGARILLLEDDEAVIDLLDTALTARGATVVSAKNPAALHEALSAGRFDAALLDISPIRDDLAGAFDAVRRASPAARLIVISGSAGNEPSLPSSASAIWVRKPFEIREIVEALILAR